MDVRELKNYILDEHQVGTILESLGCHSITEHDGYISCANPDGDNRSAIIVYLNENLTIIDYTRELAKTKRTTDIFDLVSYFKNLTFPESITYICDLFGIDIYSSNKITSELNQIINFLESMMTEQNIEDNSSLTKIPEAVLSYYLPYPNILFKNDGISFKVQKAFRIGYDPQTNYITIPIRDIMGSYVGVKGRYFGVPDDMHSKYTYLYKCNKSKLLYGYHENQQSIKESNVVYVVESEKAVMQLASVGIRNCVSTGGKTISKTQVELLTRLSKNIIFAYDKDVSEEELLKIAEMFYDGVPIYAIIDKDNILEDKESPSDNLTKWFTLIKNNIYQIEGG